MDEVATTHESVSVGAAFRGGLTGNLGVFELTMTVLAASAPLSVMAAFAPVSLVVGNGIGMVSSYLVAGSVLVLFAFGFLAMGTRVAGSGKDAGAFYTYVSRGLGKPAGLGAAFLAIISYTLILTGIYGMIGQSVVDYFHGRLGLPEFSWWQPAFICWIIVAALGYRRIDLSAKVLGLAMLGEIAVVLIFDLAVLFKGTPSGTYDFTPFSMAALFSGNPGIGIMFAAAVFIGFEATAIYSEEVRDPHHTIPRATFTSIILIALMYSISTFLLINAYGVEAALNEAHSQPTMMYPNALAIYVGRVSVDIMYVLLVTSLFAAILSFHNALARYFYSFGVDGVLPERFGRTHGEHGSPAHGSLLQSATAFVLVMPYAVFDRDPVLELYAFTIGIGTMAMLLLLAISSVSIFVYLAREPGDENLWNRRIAPIGGVIGLLIIAAYATVNFNQFVDTSPLITNACLVFVYAAFLCGLFLAMRWRRLRPDLYARIGRDS